MFSKVLELRIKPETRRGPTTICFSYNTNVTQFLNPASFYG